MAEGVFTVRIPPEKQRQLDALAQVLERSRNWVVSNAIDQYLDVQAWQIAHIQHGVVEADQGELAPHEDVNTAARAHLPVKHVPDTLHQRLQRYAQELKCTLSDIMLIALERELARREWHARLAQRPTTDLGVSAASLLAQERQEREQDLS
jgi:predicted transcriptional regulator